VTLKGRHIVGIGDLSRAEIELIFRCADRFLAQPRGQTHLGRGLQLATLFFEPSTRTRLSFESAMNRLGGAVLTVADGAQSSVAKGETLADTGRVVSSYADIIVLRHPTEGAARAVADAAMVPVINAGDGAHEHPTQTLCDLYTLARECGPLEHLTVTLYGDLKYGRTVHSLAYGLALFGARIVFAPADPALAPPAYLIERLRSLWGIEAEWWDPDSGVPLPATDAIYLTRVQKERFSGSAGVRDYPRIDHATLRRWGASDRTLLMHPLPRAGELDPELDGEARSAYFRQAAYGVPVRMATIALILGIAEEEWSSGWGARGQVIAPESAGGELPVERSHPALGVRCANDNCICNRESASAAARFVFAGVRHDDRGRTILALRCRFCEAPTRADGAYDRTAGRFRLADEPELPGMLTGMSAAELVFANEVDGANVTSAALAQALVIGD
jgi:aspartate carbamoyltransferase catalytic subunit